MRTTLRDLTGFRRDDPDEAPVPTDQHQWAVRVLDQALSWAAPNDVYVLQGCPVHIGPGRRHVPDLVVVYRDAHFGASAYNPGGVLLVAEVAEPGEEITTPGAYARSGIPYYWQASADPALTCYALDLATGSYRRTGQASRGSSVRLDAPWEVLVDSTDLVIPHRR